VERTRIPTIKLPGKMSPWRRSARDTPGLGANHTEPIDNSRTIASNLSGDATARISSVVERNFMGRFIVGPGSGTRHFRHYRRP